ncbi:MAG: PspA/IM30 family protein [Actinobacteria bacterium]|nr:PspA/IM30 family protein [Actinomycetota bacterium]
MWKAFKRWWKYTVMRTNRAIDDRADPKIQLEQAIQESQEQHRRLKEQAANVIANQKQAEMRLNRSMEEYERLNANARQAVLMADEAQRSGDETKTREYTAAAESFANRLISLESEVEQGKTMVLQASQAAEQAKAAVSTNASALQKKLAERQKLLSQLDQAKMQEQMNTAMAQLSEAVGEDVPTFNEIRDKIEARYAKAKSSAELTEASVESNMLEIEQASRNVEAQARLSQIREQLGLAPPPGQAEGQAAVGTASASGGELNASTEPAAEKVGETEAEAEAQPAPAPQNQATS